MRLDFSLVFITQDQAYLQAAQSGIAYERSVFSTAAANWPDLRDHQSRFMITWCHGAPGIALARLGGLSIYQTDKIFQDVEVALQTTQKYGLEGYNERSTFLHCDTRRVLNSRDAPWITRVKAGPKFLRFSSGSQYRHGKGAFSSSIVRWDWMVSRLGMAALRK